jgi:3-methyl-2-oxobutanoate hydroxymethyltransferase
MGGHKVQGRDFEGRDRILEDAKSVDAAGAFATVIEGVPSELARDVTREITIPTIGIGAGPHTDGQVLVLHDILGLSSNPPSFARRYANVRETALDACSQFVKAVHDRQWPDDEHSFN